jgi:hypothetical protein
MRAIVFVGSLKLHLPRPRSANRIFKKIPTPSANTRKRPRSESSADNLDSVDERKCKCAEKKTDCPRSTGCNKKKKITIRLPQNLKEVSRKSVVIRILIYSCPRLYMYREPHFGDSSDLVVAKYRGSCLQTGHSKP